MNEPERPDATPTDDSSSKEPVAATETQEPSSPRRRWWQFSLRSIMLLTVIAAVVMSWTLGPEPDEEMLPGGAVIREQMVIDETLFPGFPQQVGQGDYEVVDRFGRVLIQGKVERDIRENEWTVRHLNGRVALQGELDYGAFSGPWEARDEQGVLRVVGRYRTKQMRLYGKFVFAVPLSDLLDEEAWEMVLAVREGPSTVRDARGRLRATGGFKDDLRDGPWVFYDEAGEVVAEGDYYRGRRHGEWKLRGTSREPLRNVHYVAGVPVTEGASSTDSEASSSEGELLTLTQARRLAARPDLRTTTGQQELLAVLEHPDPIVRRLSYQVLQREGPAAGFALPRVVELETIETDATLLAENLLAQLNLDPDRTRHVLQVFSQRSLRASTGDPVLIHSLIPQPHLKVDQVIRLLDDDTPGVRHLACDIVYGLANHPPLNSELDERDPGWLTRIARTITPAGRAALKHDDVRKALEEVARNVDLRAAQGWGGGLF